MIPALEYLIRNDLIFDWFQTPCSIFVFNKDLNKIVITISEEFKPSNYYSVKHWRIDTCLKNQALPSMVEFRVPKENIFNNSSIFLDEYNPIKFQQGAIPRRNNHEKRPMSKELYSYFFSDTVDSLKHRSFKKNWLWNQFVKVYLPDLCSDHYYLNYNWTKNWAYDEFIEEQRETVSKFRKKEWMYWQLWQQFMLLNAGEVFFMKK